MNILFITLIDIRSVTERGIYTDLIREFSKKGHSIYIVSPVEKRNGMKTQLLESNHDEFRKVHILKIKTGNIQKTNIIEKGISTVLLESQIKIGIERYLSKISFDLVIYSTPPITLIKPIAYVKRRDNAKTYLLLKDIFPQNAVDLGMMKKTGIKGALYRFFRNKEKRLYEVSDRIGCMSQANIDYVLANNPSIDSKKVELSPNCIEVHKHKLSKMERENILDRYNLPKDKVIFVYGGNLGKPQGVQFIIDCLREIKENDKIYFLIVGNGTEYSKIATFIDVETPQNVKLLKMLPKDDYDTLVAACDVGMIFLDYRFTIPNFPSRILSYMQDSKPVLAAVDESTDIGKVIENGEFGWSVSSSDVKQFVNVINEVCDCNMLQKLGENSFSYLENNYSVESQADNILDIMN